MATTNKDFRVKHGLVVEGATATVSGSQVVTEGNINTYLSGYVSDAEKGEPNGVASLDSNGYIEGSQIPNVVLPALTWSIVKNGTTLYPSSVVLPPLSWANVKNGMSLT